MSVAGVPMVDYRYDAAGRLIEVSRADVGSVNITYDAAYRRTSLTFPNGVTTNYSYDQASRLLDMKHSTVSNVIEDLTYTYDAAGKRIRFGRINPQAKLPAAVIAAYNVANQMLTFDGENLAYDANGNLIERIDVGGTTTYTWDARNRLVGIDGPNLNASFKYDTLGRRIEKNINGKTIQYLYDGPDIIQEIEAGAVTVNYLRSLNIDEVFARMDRNGIRYYQTDGLGSTIVLTDPNGVPKTTYLYDPYGNTMLYGESNDNPFQYTGRENDQAGLYYYRARYYDLKIGRFLQEDPIRSGINYYSYVINDPINYVDHFGLKSHNRNFLEYINEYIGELTILGIETGCPCSSGVIAPYGVTGSTRKGIGRAGVESFLSTGVTEEAIRQYKDKGYKEGQKLSHVITESGGIYVLEHLLDQGIIGGIAHLEIRMNGLVPMDIEYWKAKGVLSVTFHPTFKKDPHVLLNILGCKTSF